MLLAAARTQAQISYATPASTYSQDFDGILSPVPANNTVQSTPALPTGWGFAEAGANANTSYRVHNGSGTTGDTYLYGATSSAERALGAFASGSLTSQFGATFVNNTGVTLNEFTLSYTGEQWRDGRSAQAVQNTLTFDHAIDATSLTVGTYIPVTQLDLPAPIGGPNPQTGTDVALDGNDPANQLNISFTVTGLSWAPGSTLWIRWTDINDPGNDDGLAIDDLSFSANVTVPTAPLVQDNSITFPVVGTNSLEVSWTPGDGAGRIVVINTSNSFTAPLDGTDPAANSVYAGSGEQVVYNGSGNTVTVTGLSPATTYWFRVYGYNGSGASTAYSTSSTLDNPNNETTAIITAPTQLAIIDVNGGVDPIQNQPFSVTVQAQDGSSVPQNVLANTDVLLSLFTGFGNLGGTLTGTILAGTDQVVISGLTYDEADFGVIINAERTSGDVLTDGQSASFNVIGEATSLLFSGFPSAGFVNQTVATFTVQALRDDFTVDVNYTGPVTLSINTGSGNLLGTLTQNAVAGIATFNDIGFDAADTYTVDANSGSLLPATSGSIVITLVPELNEVILPQYAINGGTTASRLQYVARLELANLLPNTTYRYTSGGSTNPSLLANAPGNMFAINNGANAFGHVVGHTSNKGLNGSLLDGDVFAPSASYAELTTDANGSYTGWFSIVPTSNAVFNVGNDVYFYVQLNDGAGGTTIATSLRTSNTIRMLGPTTDARAIRGVSSATAENMVFVYDNEAGTGRPLYGTWAESDGIATNFTTWYGTVEATAGSWGAYIPTALPNGVRRIEQRDVVTAALVNCPGISVNGTWADAGNTVNPAAGTTPIVFTATDANFDGPITLYVDADGDGYGDPLTGTLLCPPQAGYVTDNTDCDDTDDQIFVGASCDDGDPNTINDVYDANCACAGVDQNLDCLGVPFGPDVPGSSCDDNDANTVNDTWDANCNCVGELLDCLGVPGGPDLPGSPCDDNDATTGNDTWQNDCTCMGELIDCLGVAGGSDLPGNPCDDGDATTLNDVWQPDCSCVGTPFQFGAGNLVVLRADASANNTTATVVELQSSINNVTPVATFAVPGTGTDAIRISGSATSTGYVARTDDRSLLTFNGHNNTNTGSNANTLNPRAVVSVATNGAINIATTYTGASGNQTRGSTSLNNTNWFIADQGGLYTNSSASASPSGNLRAIKSFGGVVYVGRASGTAGVTEVATVSAPSSATITGLVGLSNNASHQDFYLVQSGANGSQYDLLYTLSATSNTAGTLAKYSLVSGTWVPNGTYSTGVGGFGLTAEATGTGAHLYLTTGLGALTANQVLRIVDDAGYDAAINIDPLNNLVVYTAPAGTILKGVDFAPVSCEPPVITGITSNDPICASDDLTLSVTATGTAPLSYSWSGTGSFLPNTSSQSVTVSGAASGNYSVTVSNACGSDDDLVTVTVNTPITWYNDTDGDGLGDPNDFVIACDNPGGYVTDDTDLCPAVTGTVGSPCDDNDPSTINDVVDANCVCAGTPTLCADWTLTIRTDANGAETTWQIINDQDLSVLASGGPYPGNALITETICVPQGACFRLQVADAGNNGITGGGYVLRDGNGERVIDNAGNGDGFTSLSAIANNGTFCAPVGTDRILDNDADGFGCDRMDYGTADFFIAKPNPAVVPANGDGYQFWIFDPNGSYSRRVFQSGVIYNGWPDGDPNDACYLRFGWLNVNPVPTDILLNIRIRTRINGDYGPFGPACRAMVVSTPPACPLTQLIDNPNSANYSCGVTRQFNAGQKVYCYPVAGADRYRWRFEQDGGGFVRVITSTNPGLVLGWITNPLVPGTTYNVTVQASFDNGGSYCPFGTSCQVFIIAGPLAEQRMADMAASSMTFTMFPNPNRDGLVHLAFGAFDADVDVLQLEVIDLFGKRVFASQLVANSSNTMPVDLGQLASGVYVVNVTDGTRSFTQRLVMQR